MRSSAFVRVGAIDWDFWVYPARPSVPKSSDVLVATEWDVTTRRAVEDGGTVLLLPGPKRIAGDTVGAFRSIFWNCVTFTSQREHTVGLLTDSKPPALAGFPTESHSNWRWWDLAQRSKPMDLDGLKADLHPIVQPIDDWKLCRKLGASA